MEPSRIKAIKEDEFLHCLSEFTKADYFAAIKVGGKCINEALVSALKTLYELNLVPIVVHGGGEQIDKNLEKAGIESVKIDGKRVTNKETLDVVVDTLKGVNQELVDSINNVGIYARGINGIFHAHGTDQVYGHVGKVVGMNTGALEVCLSTGAIPIISCLGRYGQEYSNINGDTAFAFLVSQIKPLKVIALTPEGGVYRSKELKELVSEMTLPELDEFIASGCASGGMGLKLEELRKLIKQGFDVQITNSERLLVELFSSKGYGTYLHKAAKVKVPNCAAL